MFSLASQNLPNMKKTIIAAFLTLGLFATASAQDVTSAKKTDATAKTAKKTATTASKKTDAAATSTKKEAAAANTDANSKLDRAHATKTTVKKEEKAATGK